MTTFAGIGVFAALALIAGGFPSAAAQVLTLPDTSFVSALAGGSNPLDGTDPATYQGEYPGLGHKFVLFGTAVHDRDPENPDNEVISIERVGASFGGAARDLGAGVKVPTLDNRIQLRYYFTLGHTCGVGTPRVFLTIDRDGDGTADGNAFGYIGAPPQFGPCLQEKWVVEDLTDDLTRWDITQFGGPFYNTWTQVEAFFTALYPNHRVLTGGVVHDSSNPTEGKLYVDLFAMHNRSLENWQDAVRNTK